MVGDQPAGEHDRVGPDPDRRRRRAGQEDAVPVGGVGGVVEVPADRLDDQQDDDRHERHGHPQTPEHRVKDLAIFLGPAHLTVKRRAPDGPEEIEG